MMKQFALSEFVIGYNIPVHLQEIVSLLKSKLLGFSRAPVDCLAFYRLLFTVITMANSAPYR